MPKSTSMNFWVCNLLFFIFIQFSLFADISASTDFDGRLRIQSEKSETVYVVRNSSSLSNISSLYRSDEDGFSQRKYDDYMRVTCEKNWKKTSKGVVLDTLKNFEYKEDSSRCSKTEEFQYSESQCIKTVYNSYGFVTAETIYKLDSKGNVTKKAVSSSMWKYDDKKRKIEEQTAAVGKPRTKILYTYKLNNSEPDLSKYENNILVYQKNYLSDNLTYEEKNFFDDGSVAVSVYKDNQKIEERIEQDGKVLRSKKL